MQTSIVMETTTLPMATTIHIIYSLFGYSCSQKHKVFTAWQWLVPISHYDNDVVENFENVCILLVKIAFFN